VAVPFAIGAKQRRGASVADAAWSVQKRGWQVFGIAHLFRFQSFLVNPAASWSSIARPDILNILGLGLAATSWLCARAIRSGQRALWLLAPAIAILALTPMSREWWWPTLLPGPLEGYIRPGDGLGVFQIFPWAAYVPFGALLGMLLAGATDEAREQRLLRRFAAGGLAAAALGATGYVLDPDSRLTFWLGPYTSVLMRTGLMTTALAASKWVVSVQPAPLVAPLLLFGQASLFVYVVHVELAYGVWSYPLHYALPLAWSLPGLLAMYVAMFFAAKWWVARPAGGPWIPQHLRAGLEVQSSKFEVRKQDQAASGL
jgi:hypothetical protein